MRNIILENEINRAISQVAKTVEYLLKNIEEMESKMQLAKAERNIENQILLRQSLKRKTNDLAEQNRKKLHLQRQLMQVA